MISRPCWHIHDEILLEWNTAPIANRRKYIREEKPEEERALRLRLLKPVKGRLPEPVARAWVAYDKARDACDKARAARDKAWAAYDKAWAAYDKARDACDKARAAYDKAWAARDKAGAACDKAWAAYDKAWAAYDKAGAARDKAVSDHRAEIEALHAKECKNCTWDGWTIFPKGWQP
jgi:tetratricopeptide (TPR) repeat protein